MLINENVRILAQVRFQGYPLFSANIRPFFCRGIELAEGGDRESLPCWTRPSQISGHGAVKSICNSRQRQKRRSEQIHEASMSFTKFKAAC